MYNRTDVCRQGELKMISYIKGTVAEIEPNYIVVENNHIGYEIFVPATVIDEIPCVGSEVKIYTYLYVKEDILNLYGFMSKEDLYIFKLLITVNGIGPKGALGILSTISPDDLRFAVLAGDIKTISKAPGIGQKTAQKLIIELKDKLSLEEAFEIKRSKAMPASDISDNRNEAVLALTALGYGQAESMKAVKLCEADDSMSTDEILKLALKKLMTF